MDKWRRPMGRAGSDKEALICGPGGLADAGGGVGKLAGAGLKNVDSSRGKTNEDGWLVARPSACDTTSDIRRSKSFVCDRYYRMLIEH